MAIHERQEAEGVDHLIELRTGLDPDSDLGRLQRRVVRCRRCPRLVEWRERVAREKRASFADEEY